MANSKRQALIQRRKRAMRSASGADGNFARPAGEFQSQSGVRRPSSKRPRPSAEELAAKLIQFNIWWPFLSTYKSGKPTWARSERQIPAFRLNKPCRKQKRLTRSNGIPLLLVWRAQDLFGSCTLHSWNLAFSVKRESWFRRLVKSCSVDFWNLRGRKCWRTHLRRH